VLKKAEQRTTLISMSLNCFLKIVNSFLSLDHSSAEVRLKKKWYFA
jgi:hypothetical protein